jgi:hypothetical protein
MMHAKIWILWALAMLVLCSVGRSQFQYIGVDGQVTATGKGLNQWGLTFGWLKQVSTHHGFGVELGLPKLFKNNIATGYYTNDPYYKMGLIWRRNALPFVGMRYRLFAGNSFFIGSSLQLGMLKERFFGDRMYNDDVYAAPVPAFYADYTILNPYMRLNFETGLIWNMGDVLYGTLQGRAGIQSTFSKVKVFGITAVDQSQPVIIFRPYHGMDILGTALFGIGVKL